MPFWIRELLYFWCKLTGHRVNGVGCCLNCGFMVGLFLLDRKLNEKSKAYLS